MKKRQIDDFRENAHKVVDWIADYYQSIESYPVKSKAAPGEIKQQIPGAAPEKGEPFNEIFNDFQNIILPGITHWQSPNFHAYFSANSSFPSILGEMLTAALGAQCMIWETSPAAAELEEVTMNWLKQIIGLPDGFEGVIQDTASTATLVALISAREKITDFDINTNGFFHAKEQLRVYCSSQAHSSIDKAVKIAGIGINNLVKINVDEKMQMLPDELSIAIENDLVKGYAPCCVIAAVGTTGTVAIDPLREIADICQKFNLWLHVDAAFAGSALVLPEYRWMINGIEKADSFVFNPHKWMFTNFDCSALFVKNKETLIRSFEILPEYLKTKTYKIVNDYRDWGIQLGRRFRALKLWFVLRSYGVGGIKKTIAFHIEMAEKFKDWVIWQGNLELMLPLTLNTVIFRYVPHENMLLDDVNSLNKQLLDSINDSGKLYLTHTMINNTYVLRFVVSQWLLEEGHINEACKIIELYIKHLEQGEL